MILLHIVYHSLFSLYVLKHEFRLWYRNVIGEHFGVLFIKFKHLGESLVTLLRGVMSLEELRNIVKYQVVLEHTYYMSVLVVDDICHDFRIVVLSRCKIFLFKVLSHYIFNLQICAETAVPNRHVQNLEYLSVSLQNNIRVLSKELFLGFFTLPLIKQGG